jgi:hypothetical protein
MTPQNIPVNELNSRDSVAVTDDAERWEPAMPGLRVLHSHQTESSESAHHVVGEPGVGVGSDSCDQESSAWNPRLTSITYALARLNSIEAQESMKRAV